MRILGVGAPPHVTRYQTKSYTYTKLGQSGCSTCSRLTQKPSVDRQINDAYGLYQLVDANQHTNSVNTQYV